MIETDRILLRPWRESDADALYRYASDPRVSELALWPCHTSIEMSRNVIKDFFIPNPHTFAIVLKNTDEPVGCIGLVPTGDEHYTLSENEKEVGYWIGRPLWNKGITTEALKALMDYCRDTLHLSSLMITTDKENRPSQRVAIKCGFSHVGDYLFNDRPGKAFRFFFNSHNYEAT